MLVVTLDFRAPCRWRRRAECYSQRPASRPSIRTGPGCTRHALLSQQVSLYAMSPDEKVLSVPRVHKGLRSLRCCIPNLLQGQYPVALT